jgi:uracil-DNA glycosylase
MELKIKEKKDYFNALLKVSGWHDVIGPWIDSADFDKMVTSLVNEVEKDQRFTPKFKDIFNAFLECQFDKTKVIIIGQDPYPQFETADGIAFSCSIKGTPEKSLQYIFKALYGTYEDKDCDLRRWSHQGVLLLNTALTVRIKGIGSHYMIWKPFISYLFTEINKQFKDIPIVLLGKKAEEWELYFTNQKVYKVPHPAAAAYNGGIWKHDDIFNKVNDYLATQNKTIINW